MRFQSESPFLDQEALEFLRPPGDVREEAEAALGTPQWEEAPLLEGETRLPGQFRLLAGDKAAEPRRKGPSLSHETGADVEIGELPEESESSLPGHSRRCVERRSGISEAASAEQLPSDDMERGEEGEALPWGQLQLQADDAAAEPGSSQPSAGHEDAEWQMEDPTGTLGQLQEPEESSE